MVDTMSFPLPGWVDDRCKNPLNGRVPVLALNENVPFDMESNGATRLVLALWNKATGNQSMPATEVDSKVPII
jgi:hypothetical protein